MKKVCAWCRTVLEAGTGLGDQPISHGICVDCSVLLEHDTETLGMFLDSLGLPVLVIDGQGQVVTASQQAAELVAVDRQAMRGMRGGEALRCANAYQPGGCGHQVPCQTCALRQSVFHTHQTGESCVRVRARKDQVVGETTVPVEFRISTERTGGLVLLRIDEVAVLSPAISADS